MATSPFSEASYCKILVPRLTHKRGRQGVAHDREPVESAAFRGSDGLEPPKSVTVRTSFIRTKNPRPPVTVSSIGRGVEVPGEIGDPADVGPDRLGGTVAEDQVLGHAAAQRCHGQLLSRWDARTGSPSATSRIEERSRAWTGAVRTGCRGMGSGASKGGRELRQRGEASA